MLVREGRVALRGKKVFDPEERTFENDSITVDGNEIGHATLAYFMMNKPRGYVTTAKDEKDRLTVMDLFREQHTKLYPGKPVPHISPVGRLDKASEGLLLFSNDTKWADSLLDHQNDAKKAHLKIYRVQISGHISKENLQRMVSGMNVPPRIFGEKPEFMHAVSAKIFQGSEKNCWLEVALDEGKNREIRRMLKELGHDVLRLIRIKFCNYELGNLKSGEIREIKIHP